MSAPLLQHPWYYLDENRQQHGPVSLSELNQLLQAQEQEDDETSQEEKNEGPVINGMTLLWSPQLSQWTPLSEIPNMIETLHGVLDEQQGGSTSSSQQQPPSASLEKSTHHTQQQQQVNGDQWSPQAATASTRGQQWYYVDAQRQRQGPVTAQGLASLFCSGQIDNDTLLWTAGMTDWIPLSMEPSMSDFVGQVFREQIQSAKPSATATTSAAATEEVQTTQSSGNGSQTQEQQNSKKAGHKRKQKSSKKKRENPWVYITGLPEDIEFEELHDTFKKCGILKRDIITNEPRIKIYKDEEGRPKGDASICYLQETSVDLALDIIDGSEIRPGYRINVEQAEFQPSKKSKTNDTRTDDSGRNLSKEQIEKLAKIRRKEQETALSWAEDGSTSTGLKIVVLKNVFSPGELQAKSGSTEKLKDDLRSECQAEFGDVSKVTVFENNPEGVVLVKFKNDGAAAKCLHSMNQRNHSGRTLIAEFYDGITDYRCDTHQVDEEEEEERLDEFGEWLESGEAEHPPDKI
eukprot:gb/GECG01016603.1/.p1 GENE.gb/GECG01016603.1/~~gb/GECG01016603.1/.p1  ORF type:complete len:519 (+),score=101.82 gb/GECG01016603.1/:1-1557(+)